jgi:prolyl 3-hydroxylase /prolyl 3,4-dihydroxylase
LSTIGGGRVPGTYTVGEVDSGEISWSCVGPAHKRRHLCLTEKTSITGKKRTLDESDDPRVKLGLVLRDIKSSLFASQAFSRYLELLTSLRPTGHRNEIRRFRPGLDYTVAHMGAMSKEPRLE